jgi:small subunit ribosomal protein S17
MEPGKTEASPSEARKRAPRRMALGVVTSDKMAKTITVQISRKVRHPVYGKYVTRYVSLKAHDEERKAHRGDTVEIAWARRLSKTKFWRLVRVVSKARVEAVRGDAEIPTATPKTAPAPAASTPAPSSAPAEGSATTESAS